jgi:GT2 family glycosyltransferase
VLVPPPGDVTIAMPTFEPDPVLLRRVVASALSQATQPLVIVDMSRSDAVQRVTAEFSGVTLVRMPESNAVGQSRNACLRHSTTRYVLFLDSDAVPTPGWAAAMCAGFDEPRVAIVGARVLPEWEHPPPALFQTATASDWLSMFDLGPTSKRVPRVMGTSYAIDRERLGDAPFDDRLGRRPGVQVAHEEVELALEAARRGWSCWYAADAVVCHHIPATRATWRWMWKRAHTAGRETHLHPDEGLAPLPRRMTLLDHAFRAAVAPPFLAGRLRALD